MKKRMISLFLVLAMVFGMLPMNVFATGEGAGSETPPAANYFAAYAASVVVDGALTESGWLTYAKLGTKSFGALWDADNLYLGGAGTAPTAVEVNGVPVTATATAGEAAWELKIPMADVNVTLSDYNIAVPVTVTDGENSWTGNVVLNYGVGNSESITLTAPKAAKLDKNGTTNLSAVTENGARFAIQYETVEDRGKDSTYDRTYVLNKPISSWNVKNVADISVLEFDFSAAALPETQGLADNANYACYGYAMASQWSTTELYGYNVGIGNVKDVGLALCIKTGVVDNSAVDVYPLNKNFNETFHIRLEYSPSMGTLTAYCDGELLGTSSNLFLKKASWSGSYQQLLVTNLYIPNQTATYAGIPADFTVSNFTAATIKNTILTQETLNNALSTGAILGDNIGADFITDDLALPAGFSQGMCDIGLTWTSSNPDVIGNDGKVTRPAEETEVTLTAALADAPSVTKTFTVKVLAAGVELSNYFAAYAAEVAADGALTEAGWLTYGKLGTEKFGALWDSANLYLGGTGAAPSAVTVNGTAVTATAATGESTWELKIPLADVGVALSDYNIAPVVTIASGESKWLGTITFSPANRGTTLTMPNMAAHAVGGAATPKGTGAEAITNGVRIYNKYVPGATDAENTSTADVFPYAREESISVLSDLTKTSVLEFDFKANALPAEAEAADKTTGAKLGYPSAGNGAYHANYGLTTRMNTGVKRGSYYWGYSFSLLNYVGSEANNKADAGIWLAVNTQQGSPKTHRFFINRQVGDTFHVRVELTQATDELKIYIDDELIGTFSGTDTRSHGKNFGDTTAWPQVCFGLYQKKGTMTDTSRDADVEITNVRVSAIASKTVYDANALNSLANAILGENESLNSVSNDLTLPAAYTDAVFGDLGLTWTSSNTTIIGNDGKLIALPSEDTEVTLTAAFTAAPSVKKDFVIRVTSTVTLDALLAQEGIVLDGATSDPEWMNWQYFPTHDTIKGSLAAVWSKGYIHFAVNSSGAETLNLVIGGKTVTVNLADGTVSGLEGALAAKDAKTGNVEISLPLEALGINVTDYSQTEDFTATLVNGEATNVLKETELNFSGMVAVPESLGGYTAGANFTKIPTGVEFDGIHEGAQSFYEKGNPIDHSKTVIVSQDLTFDALPITSGAVLNQGSKADGFYAWISQSVNNYENSACISIFYNIYTEDGENLKIRVIQDDNRAGTAFDLNRKVGDTFRLTYIWNTNNTLEFYADGEFICKVSNATYALAGNGDNLINWRYNAATADTSARVKFRIENVALLNVAYETVLDELTTAAVLGRVDLAHVQRNLAMTDSFASKNFASIPMTWETSDPSVIEANGTVHRHATEAKTATITLKVDGQTLWSVDVTVDPLTVTTAAAPSKLTIPFAGTDIKVDGSISDEGWLMNGWVLDANQAMYGSFGAQWDQEYLYLAVDYCNTSVLKLSIGNADRITVDIANKTIDGVTGTIKISDTIAEIKIPMSELLGVAKIESYGKTLPITVDMDGNKYTGTLDLSSVDWWGTINFEASMPIVNGIRVQKNESKDISEAVNPGMKYLGGAITPTGFYIHDLYNANSDKLRGARILATFMTDVLYDEFDNRTQDTYIEFDFMADKMPARTWDQIKSVAKDGVAYANYGINWSFGNARNDVKQADTIRGGIANLLKEDGTSTLIFVNFGLEREYIELDKKVGDQFRVGMNWDLKGDLHLYIDGELYHTFKGAEQFVASVANKSFVVQVIRDAQAAASSADDIKVYMTNVAFGRKHNTENLIRNLDFEDIKGENVDEQTIESDLILPTYLTNDQMDTQYALAWTSSNEDVIATNGKVTRPETGFVYVTLTATLTYADGTTEQKTFDVMVLGTSINSGNVLIINKDLNPFATAGYAPIDFMFTLDSANGSIVYAHPEGTEDTKVNLVTLTNLNEAARLNKESLRLFVSNDNAVYTEIEDFKLIHIGKSWYLYDFETDAKYIKVHYTHADPYDDASFINEPAELLKVSYDASFVAPENAATVSVTADALWQDKVVEINLPEGIAANGLRVSLDGKLLYHYSENGETFVRIPDLAAGATATLKVWNAAEGIALDNKEDVYEVVYGTIESRMEILGNGNGRWFLSLPAGTKFADGSVLETETIYSMAKTGVSASVDGGYTFNIISKVSGTAPSGATGVTGLRGDGGWGFDSKTGRMFYEYYTAELAEIPGYEGRNVRNTVIISSDDGGKTWQERDVVGYVEGDSSSIYMISYNPIIELKDNDGAGPNVDFVLNMGGTYGAADEDGDGYFCGRITYSTDGGMTWQLSKSLITYPGAFLAHEDGISEGTIIEREDGTLVYYARCQFATCDNFGVSISLDHGVTWSAPTYAANIYTVNTQPMFQEWDFDGDGVKEADLITWGGNNVRGGNSRTRNPFNIAISTNGAETFRNIQNSFSGTWMEHYDAEGTSNITNQTQAQFDGDKMIISYTRLRHSDSPKLIINNFNDWFLRTKGVYDSFEHGVVRYEGWIVYTGQKATAVKAADKATHGSYILHIDDLTQVTRSIPYMQTGSISVNIYVDAATDFSIALQPAFAPANKTTYDIINANVKNMTLSVGNKSVQLVSGWNTVTFDVDLPNGIATFSANGGAANAAKITNTVGDDYICYVSFRTNGAGLDLDELLVIDNDPIVATVSTDADKTAADAVIAQIKAIGDVTKDSADKIAAARAAYNALTVVQKDLVNRNVPLEGGKTSFDGTEADLSAHLVNYYDVLVAAENALNDLVNVIQPDAIEGEYAEEINLWLKLFVPETFKNDADAYLVMNKQGGFGGKTVTVKSSELGAADAKGRYLLKMGIASGEMTSKVTYEFFDANGNKLNIVTSSGTELGNTATFSLLDYAKGILKNGTADQKKMVAAMLTYGGYAQKYFNVDAENPAYNLLTELGIEIPSLDGITADSITQRTAVEDNKNGIKATGMQAFLDSAIYLRLYFVLDEGAAIDDYKFVLTYATPSGSVDTKEVTAVYEAANNRYYVDIEDIPAAYLDYMYNITVTNTKTNATYSVTTSVMVWVRNAMLQYTAADHLNLLKAIYLYNQAANEFFGK